MLTDDAAMGNAKLVNVLKTTDWGTRRRSNEQADVR